MIRVLVNGVAGKMGRAMTACLLQEADMELVGAVDQHRLGEDAGLVVGGGPVGVTVSGDLAATIQASKPDVMLDFTVPKAVRGNLDLAMSLGLPCVVGTTGLTAQDLAELDALSRKAKAPIFVAPNFAIGAVLLMRFAAEAARYLPDYEILETHNEKKADAPSGTALATLMAMEASRQGESAGASNSTETVAGCRGGAYAGSRVHSMRLPGFIADQEVIFGAIGQNLTISHRTTGRECFWPGVALALRKVQQLEGVVRGLEQIMEG